MTHVQPPRTTALTPAGHPSVPWNEETNPGFIRPAGYGPLVLAAHPCVTFSDTAAPRPVTALGFHVDPLRPASAGISVLHLTAFGWTDAGRGASLQQALERGPDAAVHCAGHADLLREAARLLGSPDALALSIARARRQAWHATLAEYGDLIGRIGRSDLIGQIGRADTLTTDALRALYRDAHARLSPGGRLPPPQTARHRDLAPALLRDVPDGQNLTCWAVRDGVIVARATLNVMGVTSDDVMLAEQLRPVTPGCAVIRALLPTRPALSAPFALHPPTVFSIID